MLNQSTPFPKPEIRYLKNSLLINNSVLVIGDLHLGYENEIVREGVIPNVQLKEVIDDLKNIFLKLDLESVKLKEIVLLGDLKQEFGIISDSEWKDVSKFLDFLVEKCEKVVVIKGNHDMKLWLILRKKRIGLRDWYKIKLDDISSTPIISKLIQDKIRGSKSEGKNNREVLGLSNTKKSNPKKSLYVWFLHGNKLFKQAFKQGTNKRVGGKFKEAHQQMFRRTDRQTDRRKINKEKNILILGHLHPAISLYDKYKTEKYKCFLYGNWNGFFVFILPSFSNIHIGYDVRSLNNLIDGDQVKKSKKKYEFFIIPDKDLLNFNVAVYDNKNDEVFEFGKVRELIRK